MHERCGLTKEEMERIAAMVGSAADAFTMPCRTCNHRYDQHPSQADKDAARMAAAAAAAAAPAAGALPR